MNKLYSLGAFVLFSLLSVISWGQPTPNPEILFYTFEQSGDTITNYAISAPSTADTATIFGSISQGGAGVCGTALVGSGGTTATDWVNTNWATNLLGSWTISVWTSNIVPSSTLFYIFGDPTAGSIRCFTNGVAGANNWILRGPFTDVTVSGGAVVAPHMTTFVYDATAGYIYAYLDGVLVTSVAQAAITVSGTGPFKISGYNTSNVGLPSGGLMDEFRLYNRALGATEVANMFARRTYSTISIASCGDYTSPSGNYTWTTAGTYNDTIPNAYCGDSVMTINLTINSPSADTITIATCDSYTSPSGNYTWMTSGTYMDTIPNAVGCDSVITVDLTITMSTSSSMGIIACDSYITPSGDTLTLSGTYMDTIPNAAGCDSIITIVLGINSTTSSTISPLSCGSYTAPDGMVYSSSGTYVAVIPNMGGCDSTITINLTVNNIDTSVTSTGLTATANATGVTYQWLDCDNGYALIAGETGQSFTPVIAGNYAVEVNDGSCTDTSDCHYLGVNGMEEQPLLQLVVYPNPATTELTIANPASTELALYLFDNAGKLLQTTNANATTVLDLRELLPGIYFLKATSAGTERVFKVVKN